MTYGRHCRARPRGQSRACPAPSPASPTPAFAFGLLVRGPRAGVAVLRPYSCSFVTLGYTAPMVRPTIFDRPMTAAERARRHRASKQTGERPPPTVAQLAQEHGISERVFYYGKSFLRHSLIDWDLVPDRYKVSVGKVDWDRLRAFLDYLDGRYGKIGVVFFAEVCRHGDAKAQRMVRDRIKRDGIAAGRELWRELRHKTAKVRTRGGSRARS